MFGTRLQPDYVYGMIKEPGPDAPLHHATDSLSPERRNGSPNYLLHHEETPRRAGYLSLDRTPLMEFSTSAVAHRGRRRPRKLPDPLCGDVMAAGAGDGFNARFLL